MTKFSYYTSNIKDPTPKGVVSLEQFLRAIKTPKPKVMQVFEKIREAHTQGNDDLKSRLKQTLYSFTPCVLCENRRAYDNIKSFSGLLVLDFDKFETDPTNFVTALKDYNIIMAAWKSASGYGVRSLVKIPVVESVEQFKAHFNYLRYNHDFGKVKQFDVSPQNPVLPLFMSYDPDIYINNDSAMMTSTFTPPPTSETKASYYIDYGKHGNEKDFYKMLTTALGKITDCGHPILRATAYTLGGYVGAGMIMQHEANGLIGRCIDEHTYLSKKASTYKKTAGEMINKGKNEPIL